MSITLVKIEPDRTVTDVELDPDDFRAIVRELGCELFCIAAINREIRMFVDDDGFRKNLPVNPIASSLYNGSTPIVGTALVFRQGYDGSTETVPADYRAALHRMGASA